MTYCLGKLPARRDARDLRYQNYRTAMVQMSPPPAQAHWGHGLPFGMLANDTLGDCAEAGMLHIGQVHTDDAGGIFTPTAAGAISLYSSITGYVPGNPSSDRGSNLTDCLNYWRSTGFDGHTITAYLSVSPLNKTQAEEGIYYYGGLYTGVQLPSSAQSQTGRVWTVTTGPDAAPGSWGGHCVPVVGYDENSLWCVTWGTLQQMTWEWFQTYCDEAFIPLSQDWLNKQGQSPSHLAWGQLSADLANL